jgi:hypothetical protein
MLLRNPRAARSIRVTAAKRPERAEMRRQHNLAMSQHALRKVAVWLAADPHDGRSGDSFIGNERSVRPCATDVGSGCPCTDKPLPPRRESAVAVIFTIGK